MSWVKKVGYFVNLIALLFLSVNAHAASYDNDIANIQKEWAIAKYKTPRNKQNMAFDKLIQEAKILDEHYPHQPRILTWYGTILSSYAQIKGGLKVLPDVKKARVLLEEAIQLDPNVENGFAQGVLGTLYARVPSWPIAFGNKKKARLHLETAVQINPNSVDTNYYLGDFLVDVGEYEHARHYLEKAQHTQTRPTYEIQDRGRKGEIAASLTKLHRLGH